MKEGVLLFLLLIFMTAGANSEKKLNFGNELLGLFSFAPGYVNLNHGSYGSTPLSVQEEHQKRYSQMEERPDIWFRAGAGYREEVLLRRKEAAEYLGLPPANYTDLVLVENASSGVNAVFRSLKFQKGDRVLITSTAYSMVKNLLKYLTERDGIEVIQVQLVFPLSGDDDVLRPIAEAVAQYGSTIKLASFSHIESVPGFILPIKEIIKICKGAGIRVFVDAAHAIGQIPVNLPEINPDYYVTNGHKWLYCPKGTALLYVRPELQKEVAPTVVHSEWASSKSFADNFIYTGTRDYTAYVSLGAALEFRRQFGESEIMAYLHDLAWWAGNHLAAKWNTSTLVPEHMVGSMIDIELPVSSYEEAEALRIEIYNKYQTYFIIHQLQGKVFTRLSAQIFLEQQDFINLGERVLETLQHLRME